MSGFRVTDVERNYGPNGERIGQFTDKSIHWELQNPILPIGVLGLESDTGRIKWGDGENAWNKLPYRTEVLKDVCQVERSGKDENGIFTVVTRKRADGTKFRTNTLTGGTSPEYTQRIVSYYDEDGETLLARTVYVLSYEGGHLIQEELLSNFLPEDLVTSGLILNLDASIPLSYDGSSTIWHDLSGKNNDATLFNGVTYSATNNGSLVFDGDDDYASISSVTGVNQNELTILCFIRPQNSFELEDIIAQAGFRLMTRAYQGGGGYGTGWAFWPWPGLGVVREGPTLSLNTWYCLAVTYSPSNLSLYTNGEKSLSINNPGPLNYTGNLEIAKGVGSFQHYFSGKLPVFLMYDRVLTEQEIKQNYDAFAGRYIISMQPIVTNGLAVHLDAGITESYPGTGDTWYDLTGNERNGVIVDAIFDTEKQGSFQFGEDTYATVQLTDWSFTGDFSYNVWAKVGSSGSSVWQTIIDFPDDQFFLGIRYNELSGYTSYGNDSLLRTDYYLAEDTWYNICMTYEASGTFKFYVNSLLVHSAEITPNMEPDDNYLSIGSGGGGNNEFWMGKISKILFYDRVLTQSEVDKNFNAMKARYGLVAET